MALGTLGWNDQSKSESVFTYGKPDERIRWRIMRSRLAATSDSVISAIASEKSRSPSPTMRT